MNLQVALAVLLVLQGLKHSDTGAIRAGVGTLEDLMKNTISLSARDQEVYNALWQMLYVIVYPASD